MSMTQRNIKNGAAQYRLVDVESSVKGASPHKLIQLLLEGAISKIQVARVLMDNRQIGPKCEHIERALAIINGLKSALNLKAGGQIAANLDALYDYVGRRLIIANYYNDTAILEEVVRLLKEILIGWNGIAPKVIGDATSA